MMSQKRNDIAISVTGLAGVKAWLLEAWPTALPLCALLLEDIPYQHADLLIAA